MPSLGAVQDHALRCAPTTCHPAFVIRALGIRHSFVIRAFDIRRSRGGARLLDPPYDLDRPYDLALAPYFPPLAGPQSKSRAAAAIVAYRSGRSFKSTDEKAMRISRSPSEITPTPYFSKRCLR